MSTVYHVIFAICRKRTGKILGLLFVLLVAAGFQLLTPWPFKLLLDNVIGTELIDSQTLLGRLLNLFTSKEALGAFVVFLYISFNVLANVFEYAKSDLSARVIRQLIMEFSTKTFANMEIFDFGFFRNQNIGDYIYRLSYDVSAFGELLDDGIFPMATSLLYLGVATVVLWSIHPNLTIFSLAIIPMLGISVVVLNRLVDKAGKKSETSNSILYSYVQQALSQLRIIQAYSREQKALSLYNRKMDMALANEYSMFRLNFTLSFITGIIVALCYSAIIGFGIKSIFSGELTSGLLIVFLYYLDNLTGPVTTIIYASSSIKQASIRLRRLGEFYNSRYHIQDKGTVESFTGYDIEYRRVFYRDDHGNDILHDINCVFPENSITAVVGLSGSGKSSLVSLLLRFIDSPDSGQIYIGGEDIRSYRLASLRQHIAYVPQEPILPNESIRHIIGYGRSGATRRDIETAASLAVADEFIRKHPGDYRFRVGEGGNLLSGGQRQRLMMARAYVRNADILILDEVFASQDAQTRARMVANLREYAKGRTIILVTNQLEVLAPTDRIIMMEKGSIVATGMYSDLNQDEYLHILKSHQLKGGELHAASSTF